MKRAVCLYSVILTLIIQMSGSSLLVLHYSLNKAYITERFCENKQQPQLACEGSCHLQKQVKQLEENPAAQKEKQLKPGVQLVWICQQFTTVALTRQRLLPEQFCSPYPSFYTSPGGIDFFHPPKPVAAV